MRLLYAIAVCDCWSRRRLRFDRRKFPIDDPIDPFLVPDWLLPGFKFSCPVNDQSEGTTGISSFERRSLKLGQTPGDTVLLPRFILNRAEPVNKSSLSFNFKLLLHPFSTVLSYLFYSPLHSFPVISVQIGRQVCT